jgi:hypothetical protein
MAEFVCHEVSSAWMAFFKPAIGVFGREYLDAVFLGVITRVAFGIFQGDNATPQRNVSAGIHNADFVKVLE